MHSFKDAKGRAWNLALTIAELRRVKDAGIDLCAMIEDGECPLAKRLDDFCVLADVLWAIVEPQARAQKVTREAFESQIDGAVVAAASEALWEELAGFFLPSRPPVGWLIMEALRARRASLTASSEAIPEENGPQAVPGEPKASGSESGGSQGRQA